MPVRRLPAPGFRNTLHSARPGLQQPRQGPTTKVIGTHALCKVTASDSKKIPMKPAAQEDKAGMEAGHLGCSREAYLSQVVE